MKKIFLALVTLVTMVLVSSCQESKLVKAGHLCGIKIPSLTTAFLYRDSTEVPTEITMEADGDLEEFPFVRLLSTLNDGFDNASIIANYNIRPDVTERVVKMLSDKKKPNFSFADIADFIEDNTEFYELEETK